MHHTRRKSGHGSTNTSLTDVRKAVTVSDLSKPRRPQTLARRQTPQTVQKLGKSPRVREKEWEEERWWEDDRESFPQFWYVAKTMFLCLIHFIIMAHGGHITSFPSIPRPVGQGACSGCSRSLDILRCSWRKTICVFSLQHQKLPPNSATPNLLQPADSYCVK